MIRVCLICCFVMLLAGCVTSPEKSPSSRPVASHALVWNGEVPRVELPESQPDVTVDLTGEADDLFLRLRLGFSMPDIADDFVRQHQQWYLDRPDHLRRMVERSSRYLHHIVEELDRRGMPMELALLPMVESAYNPMALSRAKASGLWQFIPSTGKRYKLGQDWWKDERRDIVASTAAALEYLQSIYEMHGDWHLALASYNWGEGAVARAIGKNLAQGLPADYLSLSMPSQTRNYVPRLQALKNIFSDPALLAAFNLPKVPNQTYFVTYTTGAPIDLDMAAKFAEMPVNEFRALNPSHNRPVILSGTPLAIPSEKIGIFIGNLESHGGKPLSSWRSYTLRSGESLEKVARRFNMSITRLRSINGIKGRARPVPGMTLLVQGSAVKPGSSGEVLGIAGSPKATHYTVRRGDTIYSIARRFKVAEEDLIRKTGFAQKPSKSGSR